MTTPTRRRALWIVDADNVTIRRQNLEVGTRGNTYYRDGNGSWRKLGVTCFATWREAHGELVRELTRRIHDLTAKLSGAASMLDPEVGDSPAHTKEDQS